MNLIKLRKYWYILSLLVIVPGLISLGTRHMNYGIDFTGGSQLQIQFSQPVTDAEIRAVLVDQNLPSDSEIQMSGGNKATLIRTRALTDTEDANLTNALQQKLGAVPSSQSYEKVEPVITGALIRDAALALLIAFALMLVYIGIRFEFWFGLAAIIAIFHDILVTVGLASIFWLQIDSASVAAVLTIAAYSVHDTIVIFDRIRENVKQRKKGESLDELIHHSIMQTLARSINTVMTVIFCLLALIIFGGVTIRSFMIMLLIGVISGAYSSIFNASPLWFDFKRLRSEAATTR
ncbi:MAG: protein translocase subunit SecF [Thermacetogeniaceae bacterium]